MHGEPQPLVAREVHAEGGQQQAAGEDRHEDRQDQGGDDPAQLADDQGEARHGAGQGEAERAALLLAADRVVGEDDDEEREDDLEEELEVEEAEGGQQRLLPVAAARRLGRPAAAHHRRAPDVVGDAADQGVERLGRQEDPVVADVEPVGEAVELAQVGGDGRLVAGDGGAVLARAQAERRDDEHGADREGGHPARRVDGLAQLLLNEQPDHGPPPPSRRRSRP